jgi:hypothetical protein
MAEKDAYYFSHDSNSVHDPKIIKMRIVYGMTGYGAFWAVIERLRESRDYKFKLEEIDLLKFDLQYAEINQFIDDCINKFELFESDGVYFWSNSLLRRMQKMDERREKATCSANARWAKEKNNSNASAIQAQSESNAIKEKKEKESKENPPQTYQKNRYSLTTEYGLYQDILKIFNLTITDLPYTDNRHWSLHRLRGDPDIGWDRCIQAATNFKDDEFYFKQGFDWLFNSGNDAKTKDRVSQWAAKSAQAEKPKIIRTLN